MSQFVLQFWSKNGSRRPILSSRYFWRIRHPEQLRAVVKAEKEKIIKCSKKNTRVRALIKKEGEEIWRVISDRLIEQENFSV